MTTSKKSIIVNIISWLYAVLFLYTGIYKFIDHVLFKETMTKSALIRRFSGIIAITIPSLELLIAFALLMPFFLYTPRTRKWGLYAGTALMTIFTIYVGYMLKFVPDLPCSCGGIISKMSWHQHLYFNSCFTALGLLAILLNTRQSEEKQNKLTFS